MSKLRVAITTSDQEACGFYRVRGPAYALADQGHIDLVEYPEIKLKAKKLADGSAEILGIENPPDCDVIVMQRIVEKHLADSVQHFRNLGIAVVMDIDDDFQNIPPWHSFHQFHSPAQNPLYNWKHFKRACADSDLVTHSTPALSRYAVRDNGMLVRNYVPKSYLDISSERDGHTVGWGGIVPTHPMDLDVTHGGVGRAVDECGARFLNVGDGLQIKEKLGLSEDPEATGIVEFTRYSQEVARFDVGIAPLADIEFCRAKTPLKAIEMSAVGVAWVGSILPEYEWLQQTLGVGQLCKPRSRDWYRSIKRLLDDDAFREEEQERGRAAVADMLILEDQAASVHLEAWTEAYENFHR